MDADQQIIKMNCLPSHHHRLQQQQPQQQRQSLSHHRSHSDQQRSSPLSNAVANNNNNKNPGATAAGNYACSNTSNNSCFSPNTNEITDSQELQLSTSTQNNGPTAAPAQALNPLSVMDNLLVQNANQSLDVQQRMIKAHPMYPLLMVLFRQCEAGTIRPGSPPAMELFNEELRVFIDRVVASSSSGNQNGNHQNLGNTRSSNGSPSVNRRQSNSDDKTRLNEGNDDETPLNIFSDDPELNELVFLAVKVLRIHLQELHKVNELSKDFCARYITSLKTKFQADLLRFQDSEPSSPTGSEGASSFGIGPYQSRFSVGPGEYSRFSLGGMLGYNGAQDGSGAITNGERDAFPTGVHFEGGSDSAEVGAYAAAAGYMNDLKINGSTGYGQPGSSYFVNRGPSSMNGLDGSVVARTKRGVLPKRATQVMKQWLFQHLVHPYPTEDEKRQIASQTNLTLLQVNNWFINARRRILQPMLETTGTYSSSLGRSSSGDGAAGGWGSHKSKNSDQPLVNKKKKAATTRPSNNRFWPASLAAAAAMLPNVAGVISGAGSSHNSETNLVWTKSASTPAIKPHSGAPRSGGLNETSPSESAGDNSSPSSMRSRTRKVSSVEPKDMRHNGIYVDFGISRSANYGYNHDGSQKHELGYDPLQLNTSNTYQTFLQHAVLQQQQQQQQQHSSVQDIKPLTTNPHGYGSWPHFLDDRQAVQHLDYNLAAAANSAVQHYARQEDGLYFSGQPSWNYNASVSQSASSESLGGGGAMSTDVRCVQPNNNWTPANSGSYGAASFSVETERSVL